MEETKWLTKTKIIIMSSIVLIIGLIVIFIVVHRHNLKREYIKYESQLEYAAPNYLLKEKISLKENEWRKISIKDILNQKLITNKNSSDCDGYVIAQGLVDNNYVPNNNDNKIYNKKIFLSISIFLLSIVLFDEVYNLIISKVFNLTNAIEFYKSLGYKYVN